MQSAHSISIIFNCGEYGGKYNSVNPRLDHFDKLALNFLLL